MGPYDMRIFARCAGLDTLVQEAMRKADKQQRQIDGLMQDARRQAAVGGIESKLAEAMNSSSSSQSMLLVKVPRLNTVHLRIVVYFVLDGTVEGLLDMQAPQLLTLWRAIWPEFDAEAPADDNGVRPLLSAHIVSVLLPSVEQHLPGDIFAVPASQQLTDQELVPIRRTLAPFALQPNVAPGGN